MATHLVSEVQHLDRNPPEIHYLMLEESDNKYYFRAGEVIGRGVASGGGEAKFDISSLLKMNGYETFLRDTDCEWMHEILINENTTENEKYLKVLNRCKLKNINI
ncbi:hypothetical protein H5154_08205 [Pseudoalteromonas sp. SR44-5]|uniref:Uncharacterized protein n=1 Tax=Pseudoalteromonas rhizosphaerae TaxID=2518973 RepID=A0ABW8L3X6_9GAMM|nr:MULTISPECIES: hypothetical protein [unclassified Pseudoalteromonas]MBB1333484.1 hypothetical protein [Pseudoalteromonas sp. SR41-6]MBB1342496.1 hypothetical protein [Pseudoalteromonas sp. SR45-6]MBB1366363.1 hypothetical protein [Pseudoalteromonas sp. SR44-5]MBB1419917.1 hypothetical protein [Pseudoalteromonas sp. SG44-1]MBB1421048.1 hypothetical protein [Pseudoalteromonas sp. SG43-7]